MDDVSETDSDLVVIERNEHAGNQTDKKLDVGMESDQASYVNQETEVDKTVWIGADLAQNSIVKSDGRVETKRPVADKMKAELFNPEGQVLKVE